MIRKNPGDFTREDIDELYDSPISGGMPMVTADELPSLDDYFDNDGAGWLQGKVSEKRYEKLAEGAEPTRAEFKLYVRTWLESVARGSYDSDDIPTCGIASYENPAGETRYAIVCGGGYSFTDVRRWLHKADIKTLEDAERLLSGLMDIDSLVQAVKKR